VSRFSEARERWGLTANDELGTLPESQTRLGWRGGPGVRDERVSISSLSLYALFGALLFLVTSFVESVWLSQASTPVLLDVVLLSLCAAGSVFAGHIRPHFGLFAGATMVLIVALAHFLGAGCGAVAGADGSSAMSPGAAPPLRVGMR
jgi:hypothetical protein